jgi:hypothetical protein
LRLPTSHSRPRGALSTASGSGHAQSPRKTYMDELPGDRRLRNATFRPCRRPFRRQESACEPRSRLSHAQGRGPASCPAEAPSSLPVSSATVTAAAVAISAPPNLHHVRLLHSLCDGYVCHWPRVADPERLGRSLIAARRLSLTGGHILSVRPLDSQDTVTGAPSPARPPN